MIKLKDVLNDFKTKNLINLENHENNLKESLKNHEKIELIKNLLLEEEVKKNLENIENFKKKSEKINLLKKFIKIYRLLDNFENLQIEKQNFFDLKKFLNSLQKNLEFKNFEDFENLEYFEIIKKKMFIKIEKIKKDILYYLENDKTKILDKNFDLENFQFSDFSLLALKSFFLLNLLKWIFLKKLENDDFFIFEKIVKNSNLKIYFSAAEKIFLKNKNSKNENLAFFKFLEDFKKRMNVLLNSKKEKIFVFFFINEFFTYQFVKQDLKDEKKLLSTYLKKYFEIIIEENILVKNKLEKQYILFIKNLFIKKFGNKIQKDIFFEFSSNLNHYIKKINFFYFCENKKILKIDSDLYNEIENFYFKEIKYLIKIFFLNFEKFVVLILPLFENLQIFFEFVLRNEKKIFLISEKIKISKLLTKINNFFLLQINCLEKKEFSEIFEKDFFENENKINEIFLKIEKNLQKFVFSKFHSLIQNPDNIYKIDNFFLQMKKETQKKGFDFSEISQNPKFEEILIIIQKRILIKLKEEIKLNIHQFKIIGKKFNQYFEELLENCRLKN